MNILYLIGSREWKNITFNNTLHYLRDKEQENFKSTSKATRFIKCAKNKKETKSNTRRRHSSKRDYSSKNSVSIILVSRKFSQKNRLLEDSDKWRPPRSSVHHLLSKLNPATTAQRWKHRWKPPERWKNRGGGMVNRKHGRMAAQFIQILLPGSGWPLLDRSSSTPPTFVLLLRLLLSSFPLLFLFLRRRGAPIEQWSPRCT